MNLTIVARRRTIALAIHGATAMDSKRREVLIPERAPKPLGPYSHGVRSGRWGFTSGTIGNDPASGKLVPGGVAAETRPGVTNLSGTLRAGGTALTHVVKTTV